MQFHYQMQDLELPATDQYQVPTVYTHQQPQQTHSYRHQFTVDQLRLK